MSAKSFRKIAVLAVVLVCISAGYVKADKLALQAKLSKDVKIQLNDVTIAEALQKIGQKAGVKFVLSDEAVWKLPYGEATRLSVALAGPLADSMTKMLNVFFMRYAAGDGVFTIYPRPELEHILGRPTAKQLELLREIYTAPVETYQESPQKTINNTLGDVVITPTLVHRRIDEILHELAGMEEGLDKFDLPGPMTIANMLDQIRVETPIGQKMYMKKGKWYLSEITFPGQIPEIWVVNKMDFRVAKLNQIVDISFKEEKAEVIIQRLAKWTGMDMLIQKQDPSWLQETMSADMQNITLRQAMRNIVTTVDGDISFDIGDNEIRMVGPKLTKEVATKVVAPRATRRRLVVSGDYVGKISIPMDGGKYYIEFMLREKDLTEELKKLRAEKMKEVLGEPEKPAEKVDSVSSTE